MKNDPVSYCHVDTPLGEAVAATRGNTLIGFWFVGQKYFRKKRSPGSKMRTPLYSLLCATGCAGISPEKRRLWILRLRPEGHRSRKLYGVFSSKSLMAA